MTPEQRKNFRWTFAGQILVSMQFFDQPQKAIEYADALIKALEESDEKVKWCPNIWHQTKNSLKCPICGEKRWTFTRGKTMRVDVRSPRAMDTEALCIFYVHIDALLDVVEAVKKLMYYSPQPHPLLVNGPHGFAETLKKLDDSIAKLEAIK